MSAHSDGDAEFRKKIQQIGENEQHAREYLERATPETPRLQTLPAASRRNFADPFTIAEFESDRCPHEGVIHPDVSPPAPVNLPPYITRCVRVKGHDGVHAADFHHRHRGRLRWSAFVWSDPDSA